MIVNRSIAVYALFMHMLSLLSVDEIWLSRYTKLSPNFRGLPLNEEIASSSLKGTNFILSEFA